MTNKQPDEREKIEENIDIMIVNEESLRDRIYEIRGQQVMLDYNLAEIYEYSINAFNQPLVFKLR